VRIPRTTQEQAHFGTAVPLSRIRPGDLVIFYSNASHVGIYVGHGRVIVAPRPGKVVSYAYVRWMPVYGVRRPG
jgi:cell wall-associated NlpC family hydrolase